MRVLNGTSPLSTVFCEIWSHWENRYTSSVISGRWRAAGSGDCCTLSKSEATLSLVSLWCRGDNQPSKGSSGSSVRPRPTGSTQRAGNKEDQGPPGPLKSNEEGKMEAGSRETDTKGFSQGTQAKTPLLLPEGASEGQAGRVHPTAATAAAGLFPAFSLPCQDTEHGATLKNRSGKTDTLDFRERHCFSQNSGLKTFNYSQSAKRLH